MKYMFKKTFLAMPLLILISCSNNNENNAPVYNEVGQIFYNEFMQCKTGPDYTLDSSKAMMEEWRALGPSKDLLGAWLYQPASEENRSQDGFWELQWTSKESADMAWQEWLSNKEAQAWGEKYNNVLQCNGDNRSPWTFVFPYDPETFGAFDSSGYFATAFSPCNFNEDKTNEDLKLSTAFYSTWLDTLDKNIGTYAYGLYVPAFADSPVDFWFGNFHENFQTMADGNILWEESGGQAKASLESTATCEAPDLYDSQLVYDPSEPNFS